MSKIWNRNQFYNLAQKGSLKIEQTELQFFGLYQGKFAGRQQADEEIIRRYPKNKE